MATTTNNAQDTNEVLGLRSYFDLPYDIRELIYENFDDLPPANDGVSFSGIILSCQQAKNKVEHIAVVRTKKQLRDFKALLLSKAGVEADISQSLSAIAGNPCFAQLRQVNIAVPFDKIFNARSIPGYPADDVTPGYRWVPKSLQALHTFLSSHYDTVHLHLSGSPERTKTSSTLLTQSQSACTAPSKTQSAPSTKSTAAVSNRDYSWTHWKG
jgi:hypothetical protein